MFRKTIFFSFEEKKPPGFGNFCTIQSAGTSCQVTTKQQNVYIWITTGIPLWIIVYLKRTLECLFLVLCCSPSLYFSSHKDNQDSFLFFWHIKLTILLLSILDSHWTVSHLIGAVFCNCYISHWSSYILTPPILTKLMTYNLLLVKHYSCWISLTLTALQNNSSTQDN